MMKKYLLTLFIVGILMVGFTKTSSALHCLTVYVECDDGSGGSGLACGETTEELIENALELSEVICG